MRHAVYFIPDSASDLHRLGSSWLGRDLANGDVLRQPDSRLAALTSDAHRYGFHATLKAPFRLKQSVAESTFEQAMRTLAFQHVSFHATSLMLADIDGFLALVPQGPSALLDNLAADCVLQLDDFRTPPDQTELARRRTAGLSESQERNLQRWGYPYVFEEFRFHLTLTQRLTDSDRPEIMRLAAAHFAPVLGLPFHVDAIAWLVESRPGAEFQLRQRFPLMPDAMKAVQ